MATVLLIDDDKFTRGILRMALEKRGHSVEEASTGRDAERSLRKTVPDLVITDIFMPDKDGIETLRDLRKSHPGLPIIVISAGGGTGTFDYLTAAQLLGADRTFEKPVRPADILDAIAELTVKN